MWCSWAGPPESVLTNLGGVFQREFSKEFELMNCRIMHTAAVTPTQNAPCELAGGLWKYHARRLLDDFNIEFRHTGRLSWMIVALN